MNENPTTSAYIALADFSSNVGHNARFDQTVVFKDYTFTYGSPFVLEVQVFAQSKVYNQNVNSADYSDPSGERVTWNGSSIVDLSHTAVLSGVDVFNLDRSRAVGYSLDALVPGSDPFAPAVPEPSTLALLSLGTLCLLIRLRACSSVAGG